MQDSKAIRARDQVPLERQHAWLVFMQAYRSVAGGVEDALAQEFRLTLSEFEILSCLFKRDSKQMRMQDIADVLRVSRGRATRLIAGLEKAGLVRREVYETDKRGVLANLTEAGLAKFEDAAVVFVAAYDRTFSRHLSDDDVEAMNSLMLKIVEGNGRLSVLDGCNEGTSADTRLLSHR